MKFGSDLGIDNWNPMAEDSSSSNFNSYKSEQSHANLDPCGLYVRNVPTYLSDDAFQSKFAEYGRIVRSRRMPPKGPSGFTIGLVTYETPSEAEAAIIALNKKPPLNLVIYHANAKTSNDTIKDVNMNLTRNNPHANTSRTLGRGRGQSMQENVKGLQVKFDGNKRVAYNLDEPLMPELIPNPSLLCVVCKKIGEYSCGSCKVPYCSSSCQTGDWSHHKSNCEPILKKKYDTGCSMSEGSNNSDDTPTANNKFPDPANIKLVPSSVLGSVKSPQSQVSRRGGFHNRSPQASGSPRNESLRQFIKINEIEDSSLPFNSDREKVYVCNFQSPSKFWVHLKTAKSVLSEMEKKLNDVVDKSPVTCSVNDVCCTVQDGVLRRIKVVEIKPNGITAEFIDYGGIRFIKNNLIYHLPITFKKYSAQAICCKLVDERGVSTQWSNDEDFSTLHQYTEGKEFKVKTFHCYNNTYDVSLKDKDDGNLYNIAQSFLESTGEIINPSVKEHNQVPNVCSNLIEGMEVTIARQHPDKDKFWGVLGYNGSGLDQILTHLTNTLERVETEVINMSCDKGDMAIGFSEEYKQYFRCIILEKLQTSFNVLYIDYGNTEKITKLHAATKVQLQIRSSVVCCTKPDSLSCEQFQKAFDNTLDLKVKSVKESVIELAFTYEGHSLILQCFPWDHGISPRHPTCKSQEKEASFRSNTSNSRPMQNNGKKIWKPQKHTGTVAQSSVNNTSGNVPKTPLRILKDSISDKKLTVGNKYNVNIVFIKPTVSEVYVQFPEDKQLLSSLSLDINEHCTSDTCTKYIPVEDEMVCCKFSEDGFWYRAQVLEKAGENKFKVHFIDYGNEDIVPDVNMKPLPQIFARMKLSACVSLFNVANKDVSSMFPKLLEELWVMEVKEASKCPKVMFFQGQKSLLEMINNLPNVSSLKTKSLPDGKELEVSFCHFEDNVYYAQAKLAKPLLESLEKELQNAATYEDLSDLPGEGDVICAKFIDGIWYRGVVKNVIDKSCTIFFVDYGNLEKIESKDLKILPIKLIEIPILAVPMKVLNHAELEKQVQANISSFKIKVVEKPSDNIPIVELVLPESDIASSSIETRVLPESITEVVITHKEGEIFYVQKQSDWECLSEMLVNLQSDVSMKPIVSPKVGQLVCVKFTDNVLYRGLIKENSGNKITAFFVDYGNTDTVTEIFSLPAKYSSFPMFSIPIMIGSDKEPEVNAIIKVKCTAKMADGVQIVRVCPPVEHLSLTSMKVSSLQRGSSDVYFHSCDGPFYFLSKATDTTQLNDMKNMLACFTGNEIYHVPSVEEILLVKCRETWYRGCTKKVNETINVCEVLLIDLGSTETIPFSDMSYIPKSISSFPILLNKVSLSPADPLQAPISFGKLYTIIVVENSANIPVIKVLQPVLLTSIERTSLSLNEVKRVVFFHKENDVLFLQDVVDAVPMSEVHAATQECASSEAISHNPIMGELLCAQSDTDGGWYRCCIEEVVDENRYKIHYIDYGNSEVVAKNNLRYLSSSLASAPSFAIAVKIINNLPVELERQYNVIAVSEPVKHIQSIKLVVEEEVCKEPAVELTTKEDPSPRFLYSSLEGVSLNTGVQDVLIHTVVGDEETCMIFCAPFNRENIKANFELTNKITEYCTSLNCSSYNGDTLPEENEMVLAKNPFNQKWYRAVVGDCSEHPLYYVSFIDCGGCVTLHKDKLRKMENNFMSLPMQSILCNLKGFKAIGDVNIFEEINKLIQLAKPEEPQKAIVTDIIDGDINIKIPFITNYLVEKGFATVDRS